ncbi:hypothetical protein [Thalassospira xiamenensis]|uniref:Uncharacterized protein n=1 Tax=Thalassospira xiamenensis TaxID=220697 RepID=A0A285U1I7_9PROT|nr:hypothetical protein [Thalassospira xiamenensis]SOC30396.1 hypothetical protein SAMN05428964_10929 [Thalassospira xiamenensis]
MSNLEKLVTAFDLLGCEAAKRGKVIDIALYDDSYLMQTSDVHPSTVDVDAFLQSERRLANQLIGNIAKKLDLAPGWLNLAARFVVHPNGKPEPKLFPFGDYPRNGEGPVGLRVFWPDPEYILVMKLLTNGDADFTNDERNEALICSLEQKTRHSDKASLKTTCKSCFPELPYVKVEMNLNRRPGTLVEVIRRVKAHGHDFHITFREFLDNFYVEEDLRVKYAKILGRPEFLDDDVKDAYIGGVAEHLCHRWGIGTPPEWTNDPRRFLKKPWFPPGADSEKPRLLVESPSAFRRRLIFIEAEPLRRIRMPHDERWCAYEEMRSGLKLDVNLTPWKG